MADFYPYLVASLPTLHFGMKPPFSYEQFLELCRRFIPTKDYHYLTILPPPVQYTEKAKRPVIIEKWIRFDSALRNELVKIRSERRQGDALPYTRHSRYTGPSLTPYIAAATINRSPMEAEKLLDEIRWKMLDELAGNHYFDFDALVAYAYKLLILQRWETIQRAEGITLLHEALWLGEGT